MLAEACALLQAEGAAELGWAESAQGGNMLQRDLALEMRRHMRDGRMRSAVPASAIRDGRGFAALRREPDGARWPPTRLAERPWGQVMQLRKCTIERPDPMDCAPGGA